MRIARRVRRWLALRSYVGRLGPALARRYGKERSYSIAQVRRTLEVGDFDSAWSYYAFAMFTDERASVEWAQTAGREVLEDVQPEGRLRGEASAMGRTPSCDAYRGAIDALRRLRDRLRREVAESHNGGSEAFIPRPVRSGHGDDLEMGLGELIGRDDLHWFDDGPD